MQNLKFEDSTFPGPLIGRRNETEVLYELLSSVSHSTAILTGISGIGKTRLSLKFGAVASSEGRLACRVHLNGWTPNILKVQILQVAQSMGIPAWNSESKQARNVTEILDGIVVQTSTSKEGQKVLLGIDNVDDLEAINFVKTLFTDTVIANCFVVISCQNSDQFDLFHVNGDVVTLSLGPLDLEDSKKWIRTVVPHAADQDCESLTNKLQSFPLGLETALAYIKVSKGDNPSYSVRLYLDELENYYGPQEIDNIDHFNIANMVWNISVKKILEVNGVIGKLAVKVLDCMAYFEPEEITFHLLSLIVGQDSLIEAIILLRQYVLIDSDNTAAKIHRLFQKVIRNKNAIREIELIREILSTIDTAYESLGPRDIAHIVAFWNKHLCRHTELVSEFAEMPDRISDKLFKFKLFDQMLEFSELQENLLSNILMSNHVESLKMGLQVGLALIKVGRSSDSVEKHMTIYPKLEAELGDTHELTLIAKCNMALALLESGKAKEAIQLRKSNWEVCQNKLGMEHPTTKNTMIAYAKSLLHPETNDESAFAELIQLSSKTYGEFHEITAGMQSMLARAKLNQENDMLANPNLAFDVLFHMHWTMSMSPNPPFHHKIFLNGRQLRKPIPTFAPDTDEMNDFVETCFQAFNASRGNLGFGSVDKNPKLWVTIALNIIKKGAEVGETTLAFPNGCCTSSGCSLNIMYEAVVNELYDKGS